jgi:ribosome-associated translation inhibitor RaiA
MRVLVRGKRIKVGPELKDEVTRRVYFALARFTDVIQKVDVCLADLNGERGRGDQHARIAVLMKTAEEVVVEATDTTVMAAVDRTCYRAQRVVGRAVERQNKPPGPRRALGNGFQQEE